MKKGMQVITTYEHMFQILHGKRCHHDHEHQPIEGTVNTKYGPILRSKYTENYTRKFARTLAKVITKAGHAWPFQWHTGLMVEASQPTESVPVLVARKIPSAPGGPLKRPTYPRSELVEPKPMSEGEVKRRRLHGKQSAEPTLEEIQQLMQDIHKRVPRVGRIILQEPSILRSLQQLFPEKRVISVVARRGTDRTMAPPTNIIPSQAPYRRALMLLRPEGNIKYERHWEKWDELSKRQLVRPAHACRINITVFAQDPPESQGGSEGSQRAVQFAEPVVSARPSEHNPTASAGPMPTVPETVPGESAMHDAPATSEEQVPSVSIDVSSQTPKARHGIRFMSLPRWEQNMLLKMHRNLGHPTPERMSQALQSAGYRPEMVQAVHDINCPTCVKCSPPKAPRPAHLKPMLDFNHKVYLDGINWTNNQGRTMTFYHVIDGGSNYHVAFVAPAHTTQDVIRLLNQHWISWAGAPHELQVDAGTELNSAEFDEFLQCFSINGISISPESHWQNGKIERHGKFLQRMLDKIDQEIPIEDYPQLQMALNQSTHAKNSMMIHQGYTPELIVFGRHSRLPGSIMSDSSIPSHVSAIQENDSATQQEFKRMLQVREIARKAYHSADNCETLRRALLRKPCPHRGQYVPNQWIMIWREPRDSKVGWLGPHRVVIQDSNHTVWSTRSGKLYRSAPEHVRLAHPEEVDETETPMPPEEITEMQRQIDRMPEQQGDQTEASSEDLPEGDAPQTYPAPEVSPTPLNRESTFNRHPSSQQPDQEPEISISSQPSSNAEVSEGELLLLTCHEPADAVADLSAFDLAWKCELEVDQALAQIITETNASDEAMILLATQGKKQRTEVRLSQLTTAEKAEFEKAKQSEINNWLQTDTITKILRDKIPADQILKCRWILTWKPIDPTEIEKHGGRTHKAKARLVILGYMDPKLDEVPRDSPTLNKTSRMLALQLISSYGWSMMSFDIKAAFLQGQPQAGRTIAVDPTPELRAAMRMTSAEIGLLNKGAYGLIDAPYLWYCALVNELTSLGMEMCPFDPCLFVLREPGNSPNPGQLAGVLGIHVDDGICGGNEKFQAILQKLESKYPFGSKKVQSFTFTGIDLNQHGDGRITFSQSSYVRKISPIPIEVNRKSQPNLQVTENERGLLRGLIGSLQYAATNTRPDLASRLSALQSAINTATIETLWDANRLLHEAKRYHDVTLTIKPIPPLDFRFMAFSDASFASSKKPDSHAGLIIVGTHKDISTNKQCPISPITWSSKKIQKVVTSTLSAETTSLAAAMDQLSWLRIFWQWLLDPTIQWKKPEETLPKIPQAISIATKTHDNDVAVTDCKSLYDLVTRTAPPACSEFRVQLVARAIKEAMKEGTTLRWVHSGAQLADSLTKIMASHFLRETLREGVFRLCDEDSTLRSRAQNRDRIRWLSQGNDVQPT